MCYKSEKNERQVRAERLRDIRASIKYNREMLQEYRVITKRYRDENKELRAERKALQPVRKAKGFPVNELGYTLQPVETVSIEG
jgi:hypothetical protein